jgi:hypothetical protein
MVVVTYEFDSYIISILMGTSVIVSASTVLQNDSELFPNSSVTVTNK